MPYNKVMGRNSKNGQTVSEYLKKRLGGLHPAYFALVMATGIVSIACLTFGLHELARALFVINVVAYGALWALYLARAVFFRAQFVADWLSHRRGFGFFTMVAATNVLGSQFFMLGGNQGIATTLAQLVVDAFGVPIEQVRVVLGDTDRGNGFGSAGSRSLFTGGSAMRSGADRTIEEAKRLAAHELEAAAEDIRYEAARFFVAGTDHAIGLFELAGRQAGGHILVDHTHTVSGPTWPNGCHISEIELDPQTGAIAIVAYASVNDVGRVVNPMIVRGQLDGGAVQGIGQALTEQVVYDADSGQLLTGSLMDYAVPRAHDLATMFKTEMDESTPCTNNPLGVKGVGELGTIGATPCIVNAVADALARNRRADLAPRLQMPLTPGRMWALLQQVGS